MHRTLHFLIVPVLALFTTVSYATTRKVLFIGNSYTYTNSMPTMLQSFATAMGDTLIFDMSAPGGYTFQQHSTNTTTISKIYSQQWDVVVLQEQSQMPAFPPTQVETDVYPYAHLLDSMIHDNDTCTQTLFLMTWGHQNGDPMNCAGYPVICTYEGMQARLRESYVQMMQDNHGIMAPVGAAWKVVNDSFPTIALWQADSSHPVVGGSYLETSVLYDAIFHRRALGCTYTAGLPATDVATLQRIADKVTMDSMSQWIQYGHYPFASYSHVQTGANTITFTNHSQFSTGYSWTFGDASAGDTATNQVHTYTSPGIYTVTLTASNDCFTETRKDTIHVGIPTAVQQLHAGDIVVKNLGGGMVELELPGTCETLDIYDLSGRLVRSLHIDNNLATLRLEPALYMYKAISNTGAATISDKLPVW